MQSKRPLITEEEIGEESYWATLKSRHKVLEVMQKHREYTEDPIKAGRLDAMTCLPCAYASRFAGSTITHANCRLCDKGMMSGCTYVPPICVDCARRLEVCHHCFASMKLEKKRRKRSTPITNSTHE